MTKFYKYQGTGNDFVMADDRSANFPYKTIEEIAFLCNRRFGIGADGLILLQEKNGLPYMQYFNSDGKESSMCGNGGRCFAQFMSDLGLVDGEFVFYAIDGKHTAKMEEDKNTIALQMIDVPELRELASGVFELNTGSPHYVKFQEKLLSETDLIAEAKAIRYNETYAEKGINVNLVNFLGLKELEIRTYERGVEDETLSCGTGATAVALAAAKFIGLPDGLNQLKVKVLGGALELKFHYHAQTQSFSNIWLIGPAQKVFEGQV
jgi:diaminopimelate epimerase